MYDDINDRVINAAHVMLEGRLTVRDVAKKIGISKSTVHKDLTEKLAKINRNLYEEVSELLLYNKKIRHIRGGQKTKEKYLKLR